MSASPRIDDESSDLGLSAYVYGLAAGAFFWGYCLLEVPSNIVLAARWRAGPGSLAS